MSDNETVVEVELSEALARELLAGGPPRPQIAGALGVAALVPCAFTDDRGIRRYWQVTCATGDAARAVAEELRKVPGVEAAYIKPAEESP
ncbi:MAG: hypothetical protein HY908_18375 [Myxococcales bacterium]|nr:hypothetical protein [Myxococcales bacterium]